MLRIQNSFLILMNRYGDNREFKTALDSFKTIVQLQANTYYYFSQL